MARRPDDPRELTIDDMEHHPPYDDKLSAKDYEREIHALHVELVKMQRWAQDTGDRIAIIFEGRDAAGKGGAIARFREHLNPRSARVVALAKPNDTERSQWYFQRYIVHLPAGGEIVMFDRSWYNRAGVEPVMGFCTEAERDEFIRQVPDVERNLVESGIRLFKLWFTVSQAEQKQRFEDRKRDPLKQWKLSPIDAEAVKRFDAFGAARDLMLATTDHAHGRWTVVNSNEKRRARIESIRHVLHHIPYDDRSADVVHAPDPWVVANAADLLTRS
jgi:polyphosphate kinase 2